MWGDPVGFGVKKQYSKLKWGSNLEPSASEEVALSILSADNRLSLQLEKINPTSLGMESKDPIGNEFTQVGWDCKHTSVRNNKGIRE